MRRAWRWSIALLLGITAAFASALEVPTDAEVFVTDAGSRIVGIGRVVAGASFELVLVDGFTGPAVVVWLSPDGGVRTTEVVVADGVVWVDGDELTSVLPETFDSVHVWFATELGDALPSAVGQGPPDDVPGPGQGRGPPADADPPGPPDAPPGRPDEGPPDDAPGRGKGRGPPGDADPPGPPDAPPGRPDEGPPATDPPGPPDDGPPGRSEDAPGRRP